jgi:hypothetical protein
MSAFEASAVTGKPLAHPTHAQFIGEADQICGVYQRKAAPLETAIQRHGDPRTAVQLGKLEQTVGRTVRLSMVELKLLRALPEPAADQGVLSELWTTRFQGDDNLAKLSQALRTGSGARATSASEAFQAEGAPRGSPGAPLRLQGMRSYTGLTKPGNRALGDCVSSLAASLERRSSKAFGAR